MVKDMMYFMKGVKLFYNSKYIQNLEWGVKSDKVIVGIEKFVGNLEDVDELFIDMYVNMRKNKEVIG